MINFVNQNIGLKFLTKIIRKLTTHPFRKPISARDNPELC